MGSTVFERQRPNESTVAHALRAAKLGSFWLEDSPAPAHPTLRDNLSCDLAVVGGGYSGLWTALLAKQRNPDARIVLLEARTVGWAASGRNGGFCEASLTHGEENGRTRFADEYDHLERLGEKNLDEIEQTVAALGLNCDFERNGAIDVATEPHQVEWLREAAAADGVNARFLDTEAMRAEVNSPSYLAGLFHTHDSALVHPAKLAHELARACIEAGVEIFEHTPVAALETRGLASAEGVDVRIGSGASAIIGERDATVRAKKVALGTNVFPSLLKRNRLATVPVYDYVLMTEPLSAEQLASIGWKSRQGLGDASNQFHYYRLSADNRILWGGYDAIYHYGRQVRSSYEDRPATFRRLASHFFTTFPQLEGISFTHRWAGAIDTCSRFCAFYGSARDNRIAYALGYTGLGVGATRFGAQVMLDFLAGEKTERTETKMVRSTPMPFPPEPVASMGIQATRWSLNKADHNEGKRNLILKTLDAVGLGFDS
ncbi:NAD(P)/FAD-dependent oxidoreductase [Rathayibacter soli]|uniref:NAD(P)/FAD-dependent oxidoreductase n=1 Tax=Rathayibacter soli TaxID=3144168 RepID=UPI0027E5A4DB|nr:FAD-dependent oxidoreductase [Glaciibacter superstes]